MMAMFLARIKKILNLGTKSISANGTYNASTDGYDGFSSVTVNVPTVTPTSITPSNSNPVTLTANTPVTPTVNGKAIESYINMQPSPQGYSPTRLYKDEIYKIGLDGYFVSTVAQATASDINPAHLTDDYIYQADGDGYLYATQQTTPTSITPSDSSPVALTANTAVTPTRAGYAIQSYQSTSITPTTEGRYFQNGWNRMTSSGYAYSTQPSITEHVLWTNSAPTSSFSAQTVTLSKSFKDYDMLRVTCRWTSATADIIKYYYPVSEIRSNSSTYGTVGSNDIGFRSGSSGNSRCRGFYCEDNTHIYFSSSYELKTSSQAAANGFVIPTEIAGIKFSGVSLPS